MFDTLLHADWSVRKGKRWIAAAERKRDGWEVAAPRRAPSSRELIEALIVKNRQVLAGFDFPIGLPVAFGRRTGFKTFLEALPEFGEGEWKDFFSVANRPSDISLKRPFYPNDCKAGHTQADLFAALGFETMGPLLRECEQKRECERESTHRRAACCIFWTLGGNQVGKAAIDGWRSVIRPALERKARLWPFRGNLNELSKLPGCVLCETYPQEAYSHVGARFSGSKRIQENRRIAGVAMINRAETQGVIFTAEARHEILDGFGPSKSGEDPFDATVGLLSMIEVVDGRRAEGRPPTDEIAVWEGWILGQAASSQPTSGATR
jgi:hypothetical protein